jgi:hypothetical protein
MSLLTSYHRVSADQCADVSCWALQCWLSSRAVTVGEVCMAVSAPTCKTASVGMWNTCDFARHIPLISAWLCCCTSAAPAAEVPNEVAA